jgi:hypothetical protein
LGAKIGTNVKISKKNSKYSLFFGKKVAKLPIKEIYKKIHHILGLGFLSLLKNKFKKVWFCSKNLWSFQIIKPMMWHGRSSFLGFVQLHFYLFIYLFETRWTNPRIV